jgi:hypothetical protein
MRGYYFLILGAVWIGVAGILDRVVFGIHLHGWSPATAAMFFRLIPPVLFYGWIVPAALGFWLIWAKK